MKRGGKTLLLWRRNIRKARCLRCFWMSSDLWCGSGACTGIYCRRRYGSAYTAVEGSEDSEELEKARSQSIISQEDDVVVGLQQAEELPMWLELSVKARKVGAIHHRVTTNSQNMLEREVDICIAPVVDPRLWQAPREWSQERRRNWF